jgi:hypothetical protein
MSWQYPKSLRIEVKFTTGTGIVLPSRERESLISKDPDVIGVIAALFWCGKRDVDGRWFIVDASESFRTGPSDIGSLDVHDLQRLEKGQAWLAGVRDFVGLHWPAFLRAFHVEALAGHEALKAELERLRKLGRLKDRMSKDSVLELEHRNAMRAIVESLGPSVSGHIFQDLLAYLLAFAGYNRIQINPVGIPDIVVSDLVDHADARFITISLTQEQVDRLVELGKIAGDEELVTAIVDQCHRPKRRG